MTGRLSSQFCSDLVLLAAPVEVANPAVLSSSVTADPSVESPFSACSCSGGGDIGRRKVNKGESSDGREGKEGQRLHAVAGRP